MLAASAEGLRSSLEDKYKIFLNSTSEHLRDGALKHCGLYL